jgi:hypothetical protein
MDHDDAGMRTGIGRVRVVRIAAIAAVAAIGRHPRLDVSKRHVAPPSYAGGSLGTETRELQACVRRRDTRDCYPLAAYGTRIDQLGQAHRRRSVIIVPTSRLIRPGAVLRLDIRGAFPTLLDGIDRWKN